MQSHQRGDLIEENHPYRHHDIIAHRTVDFPNQQPAVETQYKPGSRPTYNCSAKKVESKPAQYEPDDGPRNLRISHENDILMIKSVLPLRARVKS